MKLDGRLSMLASDRTAVSRLDVSLVGQSAFEPVAKNPGQPSI